MTRGWCLALIALACSVARAEIEVSVGCKKIQLVLDEQLAPAERDRLWATGETIAAAPAVLQLRDCGGEVLETVPLEAPLARLDAAVLQGAPHPTVLVTVDLTAEAGTYNGPLTQPFALRGNRLQPVQTGAANGRSEPILLPLTGKAAWRKVRVGGKDQILAVRSDWVDGRFITRFSRYVPARQEWSVYVRSQAGLWESDGGFPSPNRFPTGARPHR